MGGLGSGNRWPRHGSRLTTELPAIDVRELRRLGVFDLGDTYVVRDHSGQSLRLSYDPDEDVVEVVLVTAPGAVAAPAWLGPVLTSWTPCPMGGHRPWFACPLCGRRVAILYLAGALACRRCLHLAYPSTREGKIDRLCRRRQRLWNRLGGRTRQLHDLPERPRGMRGRTYDRIIQELLSVEHAILASSAAAVSDALSRLRREASD